MADEAKKTDSLTTWADTATSFLNGCFGDFMAQRDNALAIDMAFYQDNRPLALTPEDLAAACPRPTRKVCVLLHGLCCHEGVWDFPDDAAHSYGSGLQADLGYTPFFLRYNTGLPIPFNGHAFDTLLDRLLESYPAPVEELVLIGHSMGGLVLRAACHFGAERGATWIPKVSRIFYLGTPHEGAALEQVGHWVTTTLQSIAHPVTSLLGNLGDQRSQGIKDLRHGTVTDAAEFTGAVPWLASARHYLIAGTVTDDPEHLASQLLGDGLVQPPQAGENVKLFPGVGHMDLAHDPAVYAQIKHWCTDA